MSVLSLDSDESITAGHQTTCSKANMQSEIVKRKNMHIFDKHEHF